MPLNKTQLKATIQRIFEDTASDHENEPTSAEQKAEQIANAIDTYIKTATITVPSGIAVSTAGTATAQTGATTAPTTATIS